MERAKPNRPMARIVAVSIMALSLAVPVSVDAATRGGTEGVARRGTEVVKIKMRDDGRLRFKPSSVTVDRGTRIRFVNAGTLTHTTTEHTGLWDERLSPGDKFTRRFRRAGEFGFHCTIHPAMTGTITVT